MKRDYGSLRPACQGCRGDIRHHLQSPPFIVEYSRMQKPAAFFSEQRQDSHSNCCEMHGHSRSDGVNEERGIMDIDYLSEFSDVMTLEDLCEALHISTTTASKLIRSGEIRSFRIGQRIKIPKKCVVSYITSLLGDDEDVDQ